MTATTVQIGDVIYTAEGEWSNGQPVEGVCDSARSADDAIGQAETWLACLTDSERARVRSLFVRSWTVETLDESASDGIGSMVSGPVVHRLV